MPGFCIHSLVIKVCFQEGEWGWERDCAQRERVIGRSQGAVLLNFPQSKAPQCGYPGWQISLCPLFTVPVTRATAGAGTKGGLFLLSFPRMTALCWAEKRTGGPGSHIQGRRTVLTETMSFAFKPWIRHCLNVNTCGHSLILSKFTWFRLLLICI